MSGKVGFPAVIDPHGVEPQTIRAIQAIRARLEAIESAIANLATMQASITALQKSVAALQTTSASVPSATAFTSFKAGEALTAPVAVYESQAGVVSHADPTVLARSYSATGIAQTSAGAGGTISVAVTGDVAIVPAASFASGQPVFCGAGGTLTQTPPAGYVALQVGIALDATHVFVQPDQQLTSFQVNGTQVGNRRQVDFIAGTNSIITGADDPTNNRVVIVVSSSGSGGGGTGGAGFPDAPTDGRLYGRQALYGNGYCQWVVVPTSGGGGSSTLAGLSDVTLTGLADGDVLTYSLSLLKWKNQQPRSGFFAQTTAPATPNVGDRWVNTSNGIEYTYFNDGGGNQWVQFY